MPVQYCWRRWSWMVLWRPTVSSRTNTKKRYLFHHRGLECKCKKSRDTQNNRQGWPWSTKWREKANRFLSGEHTGHRKHPFPTIQEITLLMNITRWWFRLKLKKVGKATRPFRYDLNQIPYDYTVKVANRFRGLDLVDRVPEEVVRRQWQKPPQGKRNAKKAKWLSEEALQIAEKRREAKGNREKEKYTHLNAEFQRIARGDKKAFLSDQCKEIEENNRKG